MGLKETLGINEFQPKNNNLWKALLAEFIGNLLLNFFGCISCIVSDPVMIALAFGLTIFVVVQTIGHVSGGHVNPAVTAGMLVTGNITVIKALLYIIVQCIGAIAGSAIVKALTIDVKDRAGITLLHDNVQPVQGFGIEYFLGFVLVFTVFGVCDANRPETKSIAALAIGMAVAIGHLATVGLTGSSMNPARSFGASLIAGDWTHHWVYWVGPIAGGISAALLYKHAFSAPPLGPVKIIERYTTVATDEKEFSNFS